MGLRSDVFYVVGFTQSIKAYSGLLRRTQRDPVACIHSVENLKVVDYPFINPFDIQQFHSYLADKLIRLDGVEYYDTTIYLVKMPQRYCKL